jgi:transcriptional regulator with XRE-family HTH domain
MIGRVQQEPLACLMKIVSNEAVPTEPPAYGLLISRNVVAARARLRLSQSSLAARMKALGYGWYPQTVSAAERGERRLTADEVLGLALALETSVGRLMMPTSDDKQIELPSGHALMGGTVVSSVRLENDKRVKWDGDTPSFDNPPWPIGEGEDE